MRFVLIVSIMSSSVIAQHRPTLEPHVLAGKRVVFTNWYFVRPPFFDWENDKGESVYISKTEHFGEYGAHFVTRDVSHGVKFFVEEGEPEFPLLPSFSMTANTASGDDALLIILLQDPVILSRRTGFTGRDLI
jgi:hypothetical protein